jgi:lipoate-protein ligase A
MGVDEALLATAQREGVATLRFYTWTGPWLSLGYTQRQSLEEQETHRRAGVGCVRRSTGGRAVLHGADLTYAIAAPEGRLPPGLRDSYSFVADALLAALASLGVPAERSDPKASAPERTVFDCFERPAADELCIGARKFCGSAQRRAHGALLQHGSIRLEADPPAAVHAVAPGGLGGTSLSEEGHGVTSAALIEACTEAFRTALGEALEPGGLTASEEEAAGRRGAEPAGC